MESKLLERLMSQLKAQGHSEEEALQIGTKSLQDSGSLHPGTTIPTAKGIERGRMTPAMRAIDRASKGTKHKASDYIYNSGTNRATLKSSKQPDYSRNI